MTDAARKYTLHIAGPDGFKSGPVIGDRIDIQSVVTGVLLGAWDEVEGVPWDMAGIILDFTDALLPGRPQKHELPRGRTLSVIWEHGEASE